MKDQLKIKVTFPDGSRRALKSPGDLGKIDKSRKARFVMDNFRVYAGYSDGEVDEEGCFGVFGTITGTALPFSHLLGWCYANAKK